MTIKTHGRMVTDNTVGIPQLAVTDGSPGQAIVTDGAGTMTFATVGAGGAVGSSVYIEDIFTGDGTTATFTLSTGAPYEESILTFIDGVAQPTSAFTLPSTTSITFSPAPSNGAAIRVCHLGIASSVANNSITGAKLSMGGDQPGDVLYYNGTDYQRLGIGTAGQHLATNSATNAPEWVTAPTGAVVSQRITTQTSTAATGTTTTPADNTIPQNTEGDEYLTVTITPASASSKLRITAHIAGDTSGDHNEFVIALFQDTTTNALSASQESGHNASTQSRFEHIYEMTSGTTSATTFKIRIGCSSANTFYLNQTKLGETMSNRFVSSLMVEEYT